MTKIAPLYGISEEQTLDIISRFTTGSKLHTARDYAILVFNNTKKETSTLVAYEDIEIYIKKVF